jgi:hypothetical protein
MVNNRVGYFYRDQTGANMFNSTPKFAIRYFLIGNHQVIYYTENYAQLAQIIKAGNTLADIFRRAEQDLKKIKVADLKPTDIKKYDAPELLPFLNQLYFEITLSVVTATNMDTSTIQPTKNDEVLKLMFFSFKDYHLDSLRKFTEGYDRAIKSKSLDDNEVVWSPGKEQGDHGQFGRQLVKQINEKNEKFQEKLGTILEQGQKVMKMVEMIKEAGERGEGTEGPVEPGKEAVGEGGAEGGGVGAGPGLERAGKKDGEEMEGTGSQGGGAESEGTIQEAGPKGAPKEVREKIADGKGKEYFANDLTYVGEYRGGQRHGVGYFVTPTLGMCYVESMNGKVSGI